MTVKIKKIDGDMLLVKFPYYEAAKQRIKMLGSPSWSNAHNGWMVSAAFEKEARDILIDVFGTDGTIPVNLLTLEVRFKKSVGVYRGPISCMGKVFARAFGRDSGARTGEDVALIQGKIDSGGSMKNWSTRVEEGSVFKVHGVYPKLLAVDADNDCLEIIEPTDGEPKPDNPGDPRFLGIDDDDLIREIERRGFVVTPRKVYDTTNTNPNHGLF